MIVCINKSDQSVCFVMEKPEDLKNYLFIKDEMALVDMPPINGSYETYDYIDYHVVNNKWMTHEDYLKLHPWPKKNNDKS